jgi:hypothetical protein
MLRQLLSDTPRVLQRLLIDLIPRRQEAKQQSHTRNRSHKCEHDLETIHVRVDNGRYNLRREESANLGSARSDNSIRADRRSGFSEAAENCVDKGTLSGRVCESAANDLEPCERLVNRK